MCIRKNTTFLLQVKNMKNRKKSPALFLVRFPLKISESHLHMSPSISDEVYASQAYERCQPVHVAGRMTDYGVIGVRNSHRCCHKWSAYRRIFNPVNQSTVVIQSIFILPLLRYLVLLCHFNLSLALSAWITQTRGDAEFRCPVYTAMQPFSAQSVHTICHNTRSQRLGMNIFRELVLLLLMPCML